MRPAITSVKNSLVTWAKQLEKSSVRKETGVFLLDGEHMVGEAAACCPQLLQTVFVCEDMLSRFSAILNLLSENCAVYPVSHAVMETISQVKTPQGIAAVCAMPGEKTAKGLDGHIIMLENVQDPGNVGTIIRTADAAGFSAAVLTPGCADPYSPKVLRATMGSIFRVPLLHAESSEDMLKALHEEGYISLGASLTGQPYYNHEPLGKKICLLIGNEGLGLRQETQTMCSRLYRLPMRGGAESLNAAVAAAILMYDLVNRP